MIVPLDWLRFGRGIRALRMRRRWRQVDVARRARVTQSLISRVERGQGDRLKAATLERVTTALGARLSVRVDWNGEALDRLLDERHAAAVDQVLETARRLGWEAIPEATFSIGGERGSVDVLAWHPGTATLLVCAVKSVVPDVQAMLASLDRKVRLADQLAAGQGWRARRVARLLVIEDGRTARRRVDEHEATFAARFPDRTVAVRRFLEDPGSRSSLSGLWFLAPRTQRHPRQRVSRPPWLGHVRVPPPSSPEVGSESRAVAFAEEAPTSMRRSAE